MDARAAILAQAAVLEAQVGVLRALAEAMPGEHADDSRALTLEACAELSGLSIHTMRSWARSGRLRTSRGSRGAFLARRADLDAAIVAHPTTPRPRITPESDTLDDWDREADRALRLVGGSK